MRTPSSTRTAKRTVSLRGMTSQRVQRALKLSVETTPGAGLPVPQLKVRAASCRVNTGGPCSVRLLKYSPRQKSVGGVEVAVAAGGTGVHVGRGVRVGCGAGVHVGRGVWVGCGCGAGVGNCTTGSRPGWKFNVTRSEWLVIQPH